MTPPADPDAPTTARRPRRPLVARPLDERTRFSADVRAAAALGQLLAEQSAWLQAHAKDVSELAMLIADEMGLAPADVRDIGLAAELHDVGKTVTPDAILDKPGGLDDHEWVAIRRHTVIGERILAAASLDRIAAIVRSTHERVDGHGYPDGLVGDAIPLGSRIIFAADAFDAMTSRRSYGSPLSELDATTELERCIGTQFDADVVHALLTVLAARRG